jgi:hypothetical protein
MQMYPKISLKQVVIKISLPNNILQIDYQLFNFTLNQNKHANLYNLKRLQRQFMIHLPIK